MECYKCGSELSSLDICSNCGAQVGVYKKIITMSNTFYNMGLQKARVRDLSGAEELLKQSLALYKKNIQARNLLGLVYYEMGEVVIALREWVLSKNFESENNIADYFIKKVQSNQNKLQILNQSVRKYNICLRHATEDKKDVAIIQLKKVINTNEKFVKAYQLLGLLYIHEQEYEKAKRVLKKSLTIDRGSTLSTRYLNEINEVTGVTEKELKKEQEKEKKKKKKEPESLSGNDVIIPKSTYKEINYGFFTFIYVVIGMVIGAAMVFFLVTPARVKDAKTEGSKDVQSYMDEISKSNITISDLEAQIEALNTEKQSLSEQLAQEQGKVDNSSIYNELLEAVTLFVNNDVNGCANRLTTITLPEGADEHAVNLYNALTARTYPEAATAHINQGSQLANRSQWQEALTELLLGEKMKPDDIGCLYNIGKCYYNLNGQAIDENARRYFERVIELSPGSNYAGWSQGWLGQ